MDTKTRPAWKTRLVPFVVAGALVSGVGSAGTVSLDRASSVAAASTVAVAQGPASSVPLGPISVGVAVPDVGTAVSGVPAGDQNAIARLLAATLRKIGGAGTAVRSGYQAFQRWFNNLPWYVKAPVYAINPALTVYEIYNLVRGLF